MKSMIARLKKPLKKLKALVLSEFNILDWHVRKSPSEQTAVDIFTSDWTSSLPGLRAGSASLFEDSRLIWGMAQSSLKGANVLELGPLEGGHTYMLHNAGIRSVTAVESNTRAFLKCLIVKEIFRLHSAHFLCGDCVQFLEHNTHKYDLCLAVGILYHMTEPARLLELISGVTDTLLLWTHYYDPDILKGRGAFSEAGEGEAKNFHGYEYRVYRQNYGSSLSTKYFLGGTQTHSNWMTRKDILGILERLGFKEIRIGLEEVNHANGPALTLWASKNTQ